MSEPHRRIPGGCYYCGRPTRGGEVCGRCRDLYASDPLGESARETLEERELLADVAPLDVAPDQWDEVS